MLVEIEGQFAQTGLLDPATHRETLDDYGVDRATRDQLTLSWAAWRQRAKEREAAETGLARARADEDFARHAMAEIDALDPKQGEEVGLADERALLMNRERLAETLAAAITELAGDSGGERALHAAARGGSSACRDKAGRQASTRAVGALERAAGRDRATRSPSSKARRALWATARQASTSIEERPLRAARLGAQTQCDGREPAAAQG